MARRYDRIITVRVSNKLKTAVDKMASADDVSASTWVRRFLETQLEAKSIKGATTRATKVA